MIVGLHPPPSDPLLVHHYPSAFKTYLEQSGYSVSTQRMLPACIGEFLHYGRFTRLEEVSLPAILSFYEWLHIRPLKRGSGALSAMMISHYVYALKVFFHWQEQSGELMYNPMSGLRLRRVAGGNREPLSSVEISALFSATVSLKEQAMLHLFYSCGLRRSEAVRLKVSDVQVKYRLLYVRSGKGARRRVVPLTVAVAAVLGAYLSQERPGGSGAFMLNRTGRPMSGNGYYLLLKEVVRRAGLHAEISPHYLRHSIATHLLGGGMDIENVREFLGHRCLESTQVYAKCNPDQLKDLWK